MTRKDAGNARQFYILVPFLVQWAGFVLFNLIQITIRHNNQQEKITRPNG